MFSEATISKIDTNYFKIIKATPAVINVQSKNTKHRWYITEQENANGKYRLVIFHSHDGYNEYHRHGYADSIKSAYRKIRSHDGYQITKNNAIKARQIQENFKLQDFCYRVKIKATRGSEEPPGT